jgi:hypothetical protein
MLKVVLHLVFIANGQDDTIFRIVLEWRKKENGE